MSFFENVSLALSGIKASKMRSLLTMLGIIIGISSVIAIVTVGNSLTNSITSAMTELGANQIQIYVSNKESNTESKMYKSDRISDSMIEDFEKKFADKISDVNLVDGGISGQVKDGRRYANVAVFGTNANYIVQNNLEIVQGTDIRKRDIDRASNVSVVSTKFVEKMFPTNVSPLGQEMKVRTKNQGVYTFTIIGVYEYKVPAIVSSFAGDEDVETQVIIPVSTAKRITNSEDGYSSFSVHFPPETDSVALSQEIEDYFATVHYKNNTHFTVITQNMESMMTQFTTMLSTLTTAIAIIAFISLVVGGIGVMNIMLVSVTERTREIGTRKALGAKSSAIRMQFVIESMILCIIGGIIGVLIGLMLGVGGSMLLGFPAAPSIPIIIISVLVSMGIGVFFGYYPANKASQLDPIEALRYE